MTGQTCIALKSIAGHSPVFLCHVCLIAVFVTVDTAELTIIPEVQMAIRALGPFAFVIAGIYRKERLVVVFHPGRLPSRLSGMTHRTVRSEAAAGMVGVDRRRVVSHVA